MINRPTPALRDFLKSEAGGGLLLMGAAALAMLFANLPGPAGAPPSCLRSCGLKGGLGSRSASSAAFSLACGFRP